MESSPLISRPCPLRIPSCQPRGTVHAHRTTPPRRQKDISHGHLTRRGNGRKEITQTGAEPSRAEPSAQGPEEQSRARAPGRGQTFHSPRYSLPSGYTSTPAVAEALQLQKLFSCRSLGQGHPPRPARLHARARRAPGRGARGAKRGARGAGRGARLPLPANCPPLNWPLYTEPSSCVISPAPFCARCVPAGSERPARSGPGRRRRGRAATGARLMPFVPETSVLQYGKR
jgi:hypothetical protein